MISHILYATDLNAYSAHILNYVLDLTDQYHSRVSVVHAIEAGSGPMAAAAMAALEEDDRYHRYTENFRQSVRERVIDALADEILCSERNAFDMINRVYVEYGNAADVILKTSRQHQVDLIVLGSNRLPDGSRQPGSVIESVLATSRVPVVIVPLPALYKSVSRTTQHPRNLLQ